MMSNVDSLVLLGAALLAVCVAWAAVVLLEWRGSRQCWKTIGKRVVWAHTVGVGVTAATVSLFYAIGMETSASRVGASWLSNFSFFCCTSLLLSYLIFGWLHVQEDK